MKQILFVLLSVVLSALSFTACSQDNPVNIEDINKQTILVYMPWTGSENRTDFLYHYFQDNLDSIESAIIKSKKLSGRVIVFISRSAKSSDLYEITYENGHIEHKPIKTYEGNSYTTVAGIAQIMNDVKSHAYALNYGIMLGGHGTGWTYATDWTDYPYNAKRQSLPAGRRPIGSAIAGVNIPGTRYFGSLTDASLSTEIETLAAGIQAAGMTMQFIQFDDCYLANIETAYALRHVTNFLIASTSEVMGVGMPYQTIWNYLATPTPSYASVVKAFNDFYNNYSFTDPASGITTPYHHGALSVIDCRETEALAAIMKEINTRYTLADSLVDSLQVLDGYSPAIFYDMGDYVDRLCSNTTLRSDFHTRLKAAVRATQTTDTLYSVVLGEKRFSPKAYSGITISDPSRHPVALKGKEKTAWWQATH